jgi:hypothetical protein
MTSALAFVSLLLAVSAGVYGALFLKRGNYLLGPEWLVVCVSATNATVFFLTGLPALYEVSHFFDLFSRGFGFPIITVAGLMAVTRGYKPSIRTDIIMFAASFAIAFLIMNAGFVQPVVKYYLIAVWTLYSAYLVSFALKLWKAGERGQALLTLVGMAAAQLVASIYDFVPIFGDAPGQPMNFYLLAESVWAVQLGQLYYAYRSLERAKGAQPAPARAALAV